MPEIEYEVAFDATQLSVMPWPCVTGFGVAMNELILGGGFWAAETVTVVCAVTLPVEFVAVSVYAVVWLGFTEMELPDTVPTPEMLSVVAPVTDQESTVPCPAVIVEGDAENELMTGACAWTGVTVTVAD